jgi:hypothetical protein
VRRRRGTGIWRRGGYEKRERERKMDNLLRVFFLVRILER